MRHQLASNYQSIDGDELCRQRALDLTDLMNRNLGSVFINEARSNPLQPDVQYRGFNGSNENSGSMLSFGS